MIICECALEKTKSEFLMEVLKLLELWLLRVTVAEKTQVLKA